MNKVKIKSENLILTIIFLIAMLSWLSLSDALNKVDNSIIIESYTFDDEEFINAKGLLRFTVIFNMNIFLLIKLTVKFFNKGNHTIICILSSVIGIANTIIQKTAIDTILASRDWQLDYIRKCEEAVNLESTIIKLSYINYVLLISYMFVIAITSFKIYKIIKGKYPEKVEDNNCVDCRLLVSMVIVDAILFLLVIYMKTSYFLMERALLGISNLLIIFWIAGYITKIPLVKEKLEKLPLDIILKCVMTMLILLYIALYADVYRSFDFGISHLEEMVDFERGTLYVLQAIGVAFGLAILSIAFINKSYICKVLFIIICSLQLLYIGEPESEKTMLYCAKNFANKQMVYIEEGYSFAESSSYVFIRAYEDVQNINYYPMIEVNAINRIASDIEAASKYKDTDSVEYLEKSLQFAKVIRVFILIALILATTNLVIYRPDKRDKIKKKKTLKDLLLVIPICVNLLMVLGLLNVCWNYISEEMGELNGLYDFKEMLNHRFVIDTFSRQFNGIILPFGLFLIVIMNVLVIKKAYLITAGLYMLYYQMCVNVWYYTNNFKIRRATYNVADQGGNKYLDYIDVCVWIFVVIGVLWYIFILAKYFYKKRKKNTE